jgi:hypothetical protein
MRKVSYVATLLALALSLCAVSCQATSMGSAPAAAAPVAAATTMPAVAAGSYGFFVFVAIIELGLVGLCVYMMQGPRVELAT